MRRRIRHDGRVHCVDFRDMVTALPRSAEHGAPASFTRRRLTKQVARPFPSHPQVAIVSQGEMETGTAGLHAP